MNGLEELAQEGDIFEANVDAVITIIQQHFNADQVTPTQMEKLSECIADSWGNELICDISGANDESVQSVISYHVMREDLDEFIQSFSE